MASLPLLVAALALAALPAAATPPAPSADIPCMYTSSVCTLCEVLVGPGDPSCDAPAPWALEAARCALLAC